MMSNFLESVDIKTLFKLIDHSHVFALLKEKKKHNKQDQTRSHLSQPFQIQSGRGWYQNNGNFMTFPIMSNFMESVDIKTSFKFIDRSHVLALPLYT
jgi:hypothetical protein